MPKSEENDAKTHPKWTQNVQKNNAETFFENIIKKQSKGHQKSDAKIESDLMKINEN